MARPRIVGFSSSSVSVGTYYTIDMAGPSWHLDVAKTHARWVKTNSRRSDGTMSRSGGPRIAERVDAHQPQISYQVESKVALWRAAVDHLFALLLDAMRGIDLTPLDGSGDPNVLADNFADAIRRLVRFAAAHPELNQIMVHEATANTDRLTWITQRDV